MPVVETSYESLTASVSSGPTPSPPVDDLIHHHSRMSPVGEKNGVQELRKIISMYLAHVYHNDEKRMGKRKMKNLWDKPPEDWPTDIPFVDPNNGMKEESGGKQQKPKKHELVPMYNFLRQKYEESIEGQGTVATTALRAPFPQESSCNSTVPEQGQKPIPTHSIPATVATSFMTHVGPPISLTHPFSQKLTEHLQPAMQDSIKTEVVEQVEPHSTDESVTYGYNAITAKQDDSIEDLSNMIKTYNVDMSSQTNLEMYLPQSPAKRDFGDAMNGFQNVCKKSKMELQPKLAQRFVQQKDFQERNRSMPVPNIPYSQNYPFATFEAREGFEFKNQPPDGMGNYPVVSPKIEQMDTSEGESSINYPENKPLIPDFTVLLTD